MTLQNYIQDLSKRKVSVNSHYKDYDRKKAFFQENSLSDTV